MKKTLIASALTLGLLASTTACTEADTPTAAPASSAPASPLTGTWTMTSLKDSASGEYKRIPYSGQIVFSPNTVSVQAMNPDTQAPDGPYTVQGYEAFYGASTIDDEEGTFAVEVESAAARVLIGQTLTRNYDVSGDTLTLTPADPAETWRVTYEREN